MNRSTLAAIAALLVVVFLIGASWAGHAAASILQQQEPEPEPLDISAWLSQSGSTDPVRRLDPGTSTAQIVIESNLRNTSKRTDPNRFSVRVVDATGTTVFASGVLTLPYGPNDEVVDVSGKRVFEGYINHVQSEKQDLTDVVARAVSRASGDDPSSSQVRIAIEAVLGVGNRLGDGLERLRAFDLSQDDGADTAFSQAETAVGTVSDRGNEALDLLKVDPINWDDVRSKLQAMQTAANDAAAQIDMGIAAVNPDSERSFPPTGVTGRCNQNRVQLYEASTGQLSADFWWTVGAPGSPARLTNPEEPAGEGQLQPEYGRIYSTLVDVQGTPHDNTIDALVLDDLCLPVAGVSVDFSTPAGSAVTLEEVQPTTDANGVARVLAHSTDQLGENGTASVLATVGSTTASARFTVVGPPASILFGTSGELVPPPNYARETTQLIILSLEDANGYAVADGTSVHLQIDPPDHVFSETGTSQVTVGTHEEDYWGSKAGLAGAYVVFGTTMGDYTLTAESGSASASQPFRVVGYPDQIEVDADPRIIRVDTPFADRRSSILTIRVTDSEGRPAPDDTVVEFEFVDPEDASYLGIQITPDRDTGRLLTSITNGETWVRVIGSQTAYREVELRVIAFYPPPALRPGPILGLASTEITLILRSRTVFLPLIAR